MDDYTKGQLDFWLDLTQSRKDEKDPIKKAMLLYEKLNEKGAFLVKKLQEDQKTKH